MKDLNVVVVGATGMVGTEMLRVLAERGWPADRVRALASSRSAGQNVPFGSETLEVAELSRDTLAGAQVALFSAGAGLSRQWAPIAAEAGAIVIDNSSAWRSDPEVPLCIPEINLDAARIRPKGIIANPNCSTIQMLVALYPLHRVNRIKRVVVATYQAISGGGADAVAAFEGQLQSVAAGTSPDVESLNGQLAGNLLMHWTHDGETDYQEEELKMIHETRKILADPAIRVSPTAVRVPVVTGHSEALTIEFEAPMSPEQARRLLAEAPGVKVVDDLAAGIYPQPIDVQGKDDVLVGRIRADLGFEGGLQLWVVGDNLRKGAALNAVQIAEGLFA